MHHVEDFIGHRLMIAEHRDATRGAERWGDEAFELSRDDPHHRGLSRQVAEHGGGIDIRHRRVSGEDDYSRRGDGQASGGGHGLDEPAVAPQ